MGGLEERVNKIKKSSSFYSEKYGHKKHSCVPAEGRTLSVSCKFSQYRIIIPNPR